MASVVALDQWAHWPALMETALGAQLACLCDAGGPIRQRIPALAAFALAGTAFTAAFPLLRGGPGWLAVGCAALAVFGCTLARIYGQSAMQVGNLLTVVVALAMRTPLAAPQALTLAGMFAAGCAWAMLLTLVIWRLHPYRPARQAVADIYRALAQLASDLRTLHRDGSPDEAAWDRHARQHRREVRDTIERARAMVLATVRARGAQSARAMLAWMRMETADQIFAATIALADLLAGEDPPEAARSGRVLRLLPPILLLVARAVEQEEVHARPGLDRAVGALTHLAGPLPEHDALARIVAELAERLHTALHVSDVAPVPEAGQAPLRWWATLRGTLTANSAVLRHAVRCAAAAALAFAATLTWPLPYAHWFTITLVLTMQPYFSLTFTRALERVGGTVAGGLLAALIAAVCTTKLAMSAALFPLCVVALAMRTVNFALFMACLTPEVVLLSELGQPGTSELTIALMRGLMTAAGGAAALLFALSVWPSWEPARLGQELRAAIAAHGRWAAVQIGAMLGDDSAEAGRQARRTAGVATNALEASLQRALLEPRRGGARRLEAALTIDAVLRRMAGRLAGLELTAHVAGAHDKAAWRAWQAWIEPAMTGLAGEMPAPPAPAPPLPLGDPDAAFLTRLDAAVQVLAGALDRLLPAPPPALSPLASVRPVA